MSSLVDGVAVWDDGLPRRCPVCGAVAQGVIFKSRVSEYLFSREAIPAAFPQIITPCGHSVRTVVDQGIATVIGNPS